MSPGRTGAARRGRTELGVESPSTLLRRCAASDGPPPHRGWGGDGGVCAWLADPSTTGCAGGPPPREAER